MLLHLLCWAYNVVPIHLAGNIPLQHMAAVDVFGHILRHTHCVAECVQMPFNFTDGLSPAVTATVTGLWRVLHPDCYHATTI
jgi:hypothetical protein